jgi:CDP-diacylglycerol--glycerol-3-phosphate 3-phosphatidyltransferase
MTRDEYFAAWAQLHGGYDPSTGGRIVRWWLSLVHVIARPFVRLRVPPDLITLGGVVLAGAVVGLAAAGGRWLLLAALLVGLSGLVDNLDGAVAVMSGRTSRWGYVLDSVVDRVADGLYVVALWVVGAPAWACVIAAALMGLQEYTRARAAAGGMSEVGVVTVWERPTRVIVTGMFLLGAGIYTSAAQTWAAAAVTAWLALGVIGCLQLLILLRARLSDDASGGSDQVSHDRG